MTFDTAQTSGSGLAYRRKGAGAAVVLLHGIPGSAASWTRVADLLATHLDVIVVDLLGFGASSRLSSIDELLATGQAAAVDALLDELDVGPATVVGHDFGGPVALSLLARRPSAVAALGLLATNAFPDTPIPFPLSTVRWPVLGSLASRILFSGPSLAAMLRQGVGAPRVVLDRDDHLGDRAQRRAITAIFSASLTRIDELYRPIESALRAIEVPTFVGWGDRDPFFSVDTGARTAEVAGARLRLYPGAGHFLPEERVADVASDVLTLARAQVV